MHVEVGTDIGDDIGSSTSEKRKKLEMTTRL